MLWLVLENASYQIISCNVYKPKDSKTWQLWVNRPDQKSIMIFEHEDKAEVELVRGAIDYAVEHRESVLRLNA